VFNVEKFSTNFFFVASEKKWQHFVLKVERKILHEFYELLMAFWDVMQKMLFAFCVWGRRWSWLEAGFAVLFSTRVLWHQEASLKP
jgi:hypothetical protein